MGIAPSPRTIFRYFSFSRFSMYSFINGMQHKPITKVKIATATILLTTMFACAASEQEVPVHGDSQKQWKDAWSFLLPMQRPCPLHLLGHSCAQSVPPKPASHLHVPSTHKPFATPSAPIPHRFGHSSVSQESLSSPLTHKDPTLHLQYSSSKLVAALTRLAQVPRCLLHFFEQAVSAFEVAATATLTLAFAAIFPIAFNVDFLFDVTNETLCSRKLNAFKPSTFFLLTACWASIVLTTLSHAAPYQPFSHMHLPWSQIPWPAHGSPFRSTHFSDASFSGFLSQASPDHPG